MLLMAWALPLSAALVAPLASPALLPSPPAATPPAATPPTATPPNAHRFTCLRESYATVVTRLDGDTVVLADGTRLPWDDGIAGKTPAERIERPDIEDIFAQPYPIGPGSTPPGKDEDPGRARHRGLIDALYGKDARAVRASLVEVPWMPKNGGKPVRFHRAHGAAEALARVSEALDALPPEFHRYAKVTAGTFNWRPIAGTDRLSAHAHAIAIDINVKYTHYWRWSIKREPELPWRNVIPMQIVEVFEAHGFIWGGKWFHYDTMHFEYRPELLHPACVERR